MDTHRFEVRQLSKRIHSFHEAKRPFRIYHSTSHTTRIPPPTRNLVHTCALNNILDINTTNNFAMAEPNVTMEQLAKETLKHGLLPPVVAPLPGMTVGGCFAGTATSSASFKFGYFDRAVNWVEVVLPDGRITRASRSRNRDLLDGLVGSLGSLGVVTLFQVKLVPAARFVELGYLPVKSAEEVVEGVAKCVGEAENDFVEGVVFGEKARVFGVVVTGRLCAFKTGRLVRFSGAADPWFYQHVLGAGETSVCVPMLDYLFRYDRGAFSLGRLCFNKIPFNRQTRWLADYALRSGNLAKMAQDLHWAEHLVLQDVDVPVGSSLGLLTWLGENLEPYPIFLTPVRQWGDGSASKCPTDYFSFILEQVILSFIFRASPRFMETAASPLQSNQLTTSSHQYSVPTPPTRP
jgi:FAD/FMN-containing dehydrogenase